MIAWGKSDVTDGTTIAANLSQCVAGLLIGQDWGSDPGKKAIPLPAVRQQLLAFADKLGDAGSCRRVLDALDGDFPPDYWEGQSLLYAHADSHDPLFTILSVTHSNMPKGDTYTGELHLAYARRIAEQAPLQAYTHTANAVAYHYRAKHKVYADAIKFAYELAQSQGWQDLETVLSWSLGEVDRNDV